MNGDQMLQTATAVGKFMLLTQAKTARMDWFEFDGLDYQITYSLLADREGMTINALAPLLPYREHEAYNAPGPLTRFSSSWQSLFPQQPVTLDLLTPDFAERCLLATTQLVLEQRPGLIMASLEDGYTLDFRGSLASLTRAIKRRFFFPRYERVGEMSLTAGLGVLKSLELPSDQKLFSDQSEIKSGQASFSA